MWSGDRREDIFGCSCNNDRKIHFWTVKDICSPWPPKSRVQSKVSLLPSFPSLSTVPHAPLLPHFHPASDLHSCPWLTHPLDFVCVCMHECEQKKFLSMAQELRAVTHFLSAAGALRKGRGERGGRLAHKKYFQKGTQEDRIHRDQETPTSTAGECLRQITVVDYEDCCNSFLRLKHTSEAPTCHSICLVLMFLCIALSSREWRPRG